MGGLDSVDTLLAQSKASIRSGNLESALSDAEEAVRLSAGSPESQLRRAISLFRLKRVGEAKSLAKYIGTGQEADTWREILARRDAEAIETPRIPPRPQSEVKPSAAPRIDWYQSPSDVTLVVYRKDLPDTTKVEIRPNSLLISADGFQWETALANDVSVAESTYERTLFKVEFKLKKTQRITWSGYSASASTAEPMTGLAKSAGSAKPNGPVKPAEPVKSAEPAKLAEPTKPAESAESDGQAAKSASAKSTMPLSYNKWDSLEDSDDEENDKDPMHFFQSLYKNSSPEVQRAMMKSYTESNGTALSTNWEDVKKKKVEVHPPKDMEAKKWD